MIFVRQSLLVYTTEKSTSIVLFDVVTKEQHLELLEAHSSGSSCLATLENDPDNSIFLSAGFRTGSLKAWHVDMKDPLFQANIHPNETIHSLILRKTPDYFDLISCTRNQVAIWNFAKYQDDSLCNCFEAETPDEGKLQIFQRHFFSDAELALKITAPPSGSPLKKLQDKKALTGFQKITYSEELQIIICAPYHECKLSIIGINEEHS